MKNKEQQQVKVSIDSDILQELEDLVKSEDITLDTLINQAAIVYLSTKRAEDVLDEYNYEYGDKKTWNVGIISKTL